MAGNLDDVQEKEDSLQMYIMKFGLVVQLLYTLSFVRRIRKYVLGQCPGNNLSSIGRYRRNVVDLRWEFWCSVLGSSFPGLDYVVRKISMTQTPKFAFFVNFVLLDSMLYLFFIIFFFSVSRLPIPSKKKAQQKCSFYVFPQPQEYLEPRRSEQIKPSLVLKKVINVGEHQFFPKILLVREVFLSEDKRQHRVTNYVSTRKNDAFRQRRHGFWLETSNIDKIFKIDKTIQIDNTFQIDKTVKIDKILKVDKTSQADKVQLNVTPEVIESDLNHDNLFKPCSSTKAIHSTSIFNYLH